MENCQIHAKCRHIAIFPGSVPFWWNTPPYDTKIKLFAGGPNGTRRYARWLERQLRPVSVPPQPHIQFGTVTSGDDVGTSGPFKRRTRRNEGDHTGEPGKSRHQHQVIATTWPTNHGYSLWRPPTQVAENCGSKVDKVILVIKFALFDNSSD